MGWQRILGTFLGLQRPRSQTDPLNAPISQVEQELDKNLEQQQNRNQQRVEKLREGLICVVLLMFPTLIKYALKYFELCCVFFFFVHMTLISLREKEKMTKLLTGPQNSPNPKSDQARTVCLKHKSTQKK